ncbi:spore coat protein [Halalkalibacter hemicellulosilyticus]|uniref:Inner spore coat protein D n=1 Tax=Halalkalibacter hemicellulosilyticusJCM 9152 TaxID=1236971 RepID=W4QEP6_9BACI|nr:spore coat protein [Halalkalibacter hemicellulosilyticus]GAE30526.1 inner spore coat protein D [Halalkalibacter hemicellulosilyticusJCM 9152]
MYCKPRPHVCKLPTTTQVMPAQVAPTQHNIVEKTCEYIVPEVYPTHTHNQVNHVYKHVKSFPHTYSQSDAIAHQQFVAGAQTGPGFGPGMGQVAGAQTGPMGMGPGFGPKGCGCKR